MKLIFGLIVLGVFAGAAYVRLAPTDTARWHRIPEAITDRDLRNGVMRVIAAQDHTLERLDAIIRDTPRTQVLAGKTSEGMITYVTRSAVFGFPDYTTVRRVGDQIEIYGRLRFGKSDLGVNAARINGWLMRLGQGG